MNTKRNTRNWTTAIAATALMLCSTVTLSTQAGSGVEIQENDEVRTGGSSTQVVIAQKPRAERDTSFRGSAAKSGRVLQQRTDETGLSANEAPRLRWRFVRAMSCAENQIGLLGQFVGICDTP